MLARDLLYFFLPFVLGLVIFLKAGHKFYSTTAVIITGIFMIVFFRDIKPFWMTLLAYVILWAIIFLIPKRMKG